MLPELRSLASFSPHWPLVTRRRRSGSGAQAAHLSSLFSNVSDHPQWFALAHRGRGHDVEHFTRKWGADFLERVAEEIRQDAQQRALRHGLAGLDARVERAGRWAAQH